jgi:hypothetical protein
MTIKVALEVRNNGEDGGIKCIGPWQGLLGESTSNTGVVGVAKGAIFLVSMLKTEHGL